MTAHKALVCALAALTTASVLWACDDSDADLPRLPRANSGSAGTVSSDASLDDGAGGLTGLAPPPSDGGVGGSSRIPDASLTSDVFGPAEGGSSNVDPVEVCDYATAGCDWTRVDGCCRASACERANGADVFNTYPIESCRALLTCVQEHPGCSNASDPLCFQNEAPGAPCLQEGYQASHTDPDGPFAWTKKLVACACGFP